MMTARIAGESGREVFAVPGQAASTKGSGTNRLIKDGATLVESAEDIIEALSLYNPLLFDKSAIDGEDKTNKKSCGLVDDLFADGPLHIDEVVERTGFTIQKVSSMLLEMELKGDIEQMPGKIFAKRL